MFMELLLANMYIKARDVGCERIMLHVIATIF
jgi:hypothetical protein